MTRAQRDGSDKPRQSRILKLLFRQVTGTTVRYFPVPCSVAHEYANSQPCASIENASFCLRICRIQVSYRSPLLHFYDHRPGCGRSSRTSINHVVLKDTRSISTQGSCGVPSQKSYRSESGWKSPTVRYLCAVGWKFWLSRLPRMCTCSGRQGTKTKRSEPASAARTDIVTR